MEQKKNTLSDQQPPSYLSKRNELNVEAMILFSSPQILYSVNYTPYTEQELLDKAHANVDERSESLKQIVSMIPKAEVSGDSVAFARNASSPEYATQLLSRKVFDNGTTEETYATTAVFTARTNTGSGSTSDNQVFTSYTLYATIYYSYR